VGKESDIAQDALKNAISSLLLIGEDKFQNELEKYMFFYLHCG
jgi:hypothetical protein